MYRRAPADLRAPPSAVYHALRQRLVARDALLAMGQQARNPMAHRARVLALTGEVRWAGLHPPARQEDEPIRFWDLTSNTIAHRTPSRAAACGGFPKVMLPAAPVWVLGGTRAGLAFFVAGFALHPRLPMEQAPPSLGGGG
jgi:hypothetical protein